MTRKGTMTMAAIRMTATMTTRPFLVAARPSAARPRAATALAHMRRTLGSPAQTGGGQCTRPPTSTSAWSCGRGLTIDHVDMDVFGATDRVEGADHVPGY